MPSATPAPHALVMTAGLSGAAAWAVRAVRRIASGFRERHAVGAASAPNLWGSDADVEGFIHETYAAHDASAGGTGLTLAQYASGARTTARYPEQDLLGLYYAALGLAGEAGEVANKIKKLMRDHGETLPDDARAAIADELGDVLWYAAMLAHELKVPLEDVATSNLATLRDRAARGAIGGSGNQR
jgi:NTP pyrophosphatase (non-canonical NTP hydrolase)